jgi:hypothetical protein
MQQVRISKGHHPPRAGRRQEGEQVHPLDLRDPDITRAAPTARPVLLVHVFACPNACWFALTRALCAQGGTVGAINCLPFGISPWRTAA